MLAPFLYQENEMPELFTTKNNRFVQHFISAMDVCDQRPVALCILNSLMVSKTPKQTGNSIVAVLTVMARNTGRPTANSWPAHKIKRPEIKAPALTIIDGDKT